MGRAAVVRPVRSRQLGEDSPRRIASRCAAIHTEVNTVWILAPANRGARQKHAMWVALLRSSLGKKVSPADKAPNARRNPGHGR